MKQLTVKILNWIDQGLEPKMKVLVAALFLGLWVLTLAYLKSAQFQRDDAKETISYLRVQLRACEKEKYEEQKKSLEYSNRQKEKADSILNAILNLKK